MKKAVILARVSSKEQEDNFSLQAQSRNVREYCERNDLSIIKEFKLVESSTRGKRIQYNEMINFVRKYSDTIHIVVDAVDRLQRGFREYVDLIDLVMSKSIVIHFLRENLVLDHNINPSEFMMYGQSVLSAQYFVKTSAHNIKRSNIEKLKKGEITRQAPVGYLNYRDEKGYSRVKIDPERGYLVRKAFEMYATGLYSISSLWKELQDMDLTIIKKDHTPLIGRSTVHKMLQNRFYIGYINQKGVEYPHVYEKLISEHLFYKCQEQLEKGGKSNKKEDTKHKFVLSGLLTNKETNRLMSGTKTKDRVYYRSPKYGESPASENVSEAIILDQLKDFYQSISIPEEILEVQVEKLNQIKDSENSEIYKKIKRYKSKIKVLEERESRLLDKFLDESITQDLYTKKRNEIVKELCDLKTKLSNLSNFRTSFVKSTKDLLDLLSESSELFEKGSTEQKRRLLKITLSNLQMDGKKLEYKPKNPFDVVQEVAESELWYTR